MLWVIRAFSQEAEQRVIKCDLADVQGSWFDLIGIDGDQLKLFLLHSFRSTLVYEPQTLDEIQPVQLWG